MSDVPPNNKWWIAAEQSGVSPTRVPPCCCFRLLPCQEIPLVTFKGYFTKVPEKIPIGNF